MSESIWHPHDQAIDHQAILGNGPSGHPVAPIGGGSPHPSGSGSKEQYGSAANRSLNITPTQLEEGNSKSTVYPTESVIAPVDTQTQVTRAWMGQYDPNMKKLSPEERAYPVTITANGVAVGLGSSDLKHSQPIRGHVVGTDVSDSYDAGTAKTDVQDMTMDKLRDQNVERQARFRGGNSVSR